MIYITGDTHGRFNRIALFCEKHPELSTDDILIILGDAGLNYYGDSRDRKLKRKISRFPLTIFMLHGNHEMRPETVDGYTEQEWHSGKVLAQPEFPTLLFAMDGEIYDFNGRKTAVIGGAYSVDKAYRLAHGYAWFPDEQPGEETKARVERRLAQALWTVDTVLTHTCPLRYVPRDVFLPMVDQATVDNSTEEWLDEIEAKLSYANWFCGHFHTSKRIDKLQFLYEDIIEWPSLKCLV